jgi:hypothetical protein
MSDQSKPQGQGFWKEHFESWKVSGLTQQAYCTREEISYQSFVYQHNRANNKINKTPINFIEAKIKSVSDSRGSSGLQVILPNGVRIGFDGELSAALLQTVFSSAGSIKC